MKARVKKLLRWMLVIPAALLIAVIGFVVWGLTPLGPSPSALQALRTDGSVRVSHAKEGWVFAPVNGKAAHGLVFYPGGRVDVRSYAPYARAVAARGFLVVLVPMPLSLAVLNPAAADRTIDLHPEISTWTVGGHSLGGAMAAQYAVDHLDAVNGLVLLAAYPPDTADGSKSSLVVSSLVGSQDGVINRTTWQSAHRLLPEDTRYLEIAGGNHAQFGDYGMQPGDTSQPDLSAKEQQGVAVEESVRVLLSGVDR